MNFNQTRMKKIFFALFAALTLQVSAQPGPVKNVGKSVFTLTTFKADGSLLASSHGVFVGNDGTAVSDWTPFVGAEKAVVIDASGKKMDVTDIVDANEIYDMVKFHVNGKTTGASLSAEAQVPGTAIYLVDYAVKKPNIITGKVTKAETFMDHYNYYVVDMEIPENVVSCPLVSGNGQVIGLLQTTRSGELHAADVRYAQDFQVNSLTANSPIFRRCNIPVALPDGKDDAQLALMLSAQGSDESKYLQTVENFIQKFPKETEGYTSRAQIHVNKGEFDAAKADMEKAIQVAENKADAHYRYANLIYQKEVYLSDKPYEAWSLDRAMEEAREADRIDPQPIYRHLQAQILYTKGSYQEAYDLFTALTQTELRNPELFYEAAQCKTQLGADKSEVLALLDSAVVNCPKPYTSSAAPYLLARAVAFDEAGQYRKAVADYNQYDTLTYGRSNAEFYFQREQCEVNAKMFKQALDDIDHCIYQSPQDVGFHAEKASLLLRLNQNDEAIAAADQCLLLDEKYSTAYVIKGVAQIQKGNKKAGLALLNTAKEMGNEQAQTLLDKYK